MLRPQDDYVGAPRYYVGVPTCYVGGLTYYIGARDIKWGPGILSLYIFLTLPLVILDNCVQAALLCMRLSSITNGKIEKCKD